jgi:septal ring factor EnvC (AmiA/AmiB activator)
MDDNLTYFEKRLTRELEDIEAQIRELEDERRALSRQLAKARAEREGLKFTTRKNSANRVLAENAVLQALRDTTKPLSTQELYRQARLTNYDLKETTFRSYLHRMKKRGDIRTAGHVGRWEIAKSVS